VGRVLGVVCLLHQAWVPARTCTLGYVNFSWLAASHQPKPPPTRAIITPSHQGVLAILNRRGPSAFRLQPLRHFSFFVNMDPLSITASIIALCSALSTITKAIRTLQGASSEITALLNEVSDFALVIQQVELLFSRKDGAKHDDGIGIYGRLKDALEQAERKLSEIAAVIGSSRSGPTRASMAEAIHATLPLRRGPRVIRLRGELHEMKLSIQLILTTLIAYVFSRLSSTSFSSSYIGKHRPLLELCASRV